MTRRRPDRTRNSTSRRLNSCLLIDTTATAHLPGPQNPGMCHLYLAEGCHLYIALTVRRRITGLTENVVEGPRGPERRTERARSQAACNRTSISFSNIHPAL